MSLKLLLKVKSFLKKQRDKAYFSYFKGISNFTKKMSKLKGYLINKKYLVTKWNLLSS